MYNLLKKVFLSATLFSCGVVSTRAQVADLQVELGGTVTPAALIPSSGVLNFDFFYSASAPLNNPLYPNEVKLLLTLPAEMELSTMSVTKYDYDLEEVVSTDWTLTLDPLSPGSAVIKLNSNIAKPGMPDGYFSFTLPYVCTGPISNLDPIDNSTVLFDKNWWLEAVIVGQGRNISVNNATSTTQLEGLVLATSASLPITFNYFTATSANCQADLNWSVEKEEGWETYVIERSKNGLTFEQVGSVKYDESALGKYQFVDKTPTVGTNFYRVKGVGPDGIANISSIKRTTVDCNLDNIKIYPNPTTSSINVEGVASGQIVRMYDLTGRIITNTVAKNSAVSVDLSNYSAATYKLVVTAADGTVIYSTKVTKQ